MQTVIWFVQKSRQCLIKEEEEEEEEDEPRN